MTDSADPKRLVVLKALCNYLMDEIQIARGYRHDLFDGRVVRGRTLVGGQPLPFVTILEALNPDREPNYTDNGNFSREDWVLLVQGFVEDDQKNPTDPAYVLMADVKKALARINDINAPADIQSLCRLVGNVKIEPGTVRPPTRDVSEKAFFYLRVILEFVENMNDPYCLD